MTTRHDHDPVVDAALTALEHRKAPALLADAIKLRVEYAAVFPDRRRRSGVRLAAGLMVPPAVVGLALGLLAMLPVGDTLAVDPLTIDAPGDAPAATDGDMADDEMTVTDDDALLAIAFGNGS